MSRYTYDSTNQQLTLIAGNADNNLIAPVDISPATHVHPIGSYLIYNSSLYKAISYIGIGDTLTIGTNISPIADGVANEIGAANSWSGITGKPFDAVGTGLFVDSNEYLTIDQSAFDISDMGFPSDISVCYQQLTMGNTIGRINGTVFMETDTKTTASGVDTFTFTNALITTDGVYDFYCDVYGVAPSGVVVSTGTMDVKFSSSDNVTTCRVYIK